MSSAMAIPNVSSDLITALSQVHFEQLGRNAKPNPLVWPTVMSLKQQEEYSAASQCLNSPVTSLRCTTLASVKSETVPERDIIT